LDRDREYDEQDEVPIRGLFSDGSIITQAELPEFQECQF
jgi:hypothetical protein